MSKGSAFDMKVLDQIRRTSPILPKRPVGFGITRAEYARQEGISHSTAGDILKEAEALGLVSCQEMRANSGKGGTVKVYYIPEKKRKKK